MTLGSSARSSSFESRALTTVEARDIKPAIRPPHLGFASSVLATVIVERSMDPGWLSNAYLVADEPGGVCVFVDSGAPLEPLLRVVDEEDRSRRRTCC